MRGRENGGEEMHTNSQSTGNGDEATNSGAYDMITFDEIRIKDVGV